MNAMSKDNLSNNLRLMGSPVNLSYRCKKKDDKKNIRNRPRSAMQNSSITPDIQERHRRPFSADAKEHVPSTRTFLKSFSAELLHSLNNSPNNIKIMAPTADLLRDTKSCEIKTRNREICNTSDHGSEDTFISLGTKIKARAQSPKGKNSNCKNFIKYRNIARKGKKAMENNNMEPKNTNNVFGLEVKIERRPSLDENTVRNKNLFQDRTPSPSYMSRSYESYYLPIDNNNKKISEESLAGRVSFGQGGLQSEVEDAIETYSRHLNVTKQQLSLVEEESTQDIESVPSQNASSLSPENSLEDHKEKGDDTGRATYVVNGSHGDYAKITNNDEGPRTYTSFYDDFKSASIPSYKMSSTVVHHDTSSKDSGYTDSGGTNDDKPPRRRYSLQSKNTIYKKTKMNTLQPKSLESIPVSEANEEKQLNKFPQQKSWTEPMNHSRLLYKDFFLKKEGHIAVPPNNSPKKTEILNIPGANESIPVVKSDEEDNIVEYPSYLLHSNTKTYTSRVIEDYKKEIEAIKNLHELTLKDIKTDSISPTPLNIDKMFDEHSNFSDNKTDSNENSQASSSNTDPLPVHPKPDENTKNDISKVSTEELIQNYLKVKSGEYTKDYVCKQFKKFEKKINNTDMSVENRIDRKQGLNNKNNIKIAAAKSALSSPIRNTIPSRPIEPTVPSKQPLSARLDSVQNDKDIESWMSISAPSPSILDIEESREPIADNPETKSTEKVTEKNPKVTESTNSQSEGKNEDKPKVKELNSGSTVLDIYSMLKDIESFGDHPVTSVVKTDSETPRSKEEEEKCNTPKDNFAEIFEFLEKVEESANDALSGVTTTTPQTIPKLEALLKLPATELAQRLVTALLQLDERGCCVALLQESLANHKEQMFNKVSNMEKQSHRSINKVKQDCEEAVKRHQTFIDQLINDKKTLNHRIEQLVDERRAMEEKWRRAAQTLEERHQLELRAQRDKMQAQQQVARQRWVRQKAEKIKELTVKGLEGELREMADRQQKEITDLKMAHAETLGRIQSKHSAALEELRRELEEEREAALAKERQLASGRMEKQILELEATYRSQRTRLAAEMRAESERAAAGLCERERETRREIEKWREEQEKILEQKKVEVEQEIAKQREKIEEEMKQKRIELEQEFETYKKEFEASQQAALKAKVTEIGMQHKRERDREIEKAIESMEAEAQAGRRELQDALRRNKEQYEMELRELAETEQATLRRYQDAQARVRTTEDKYPLNSLQKTFQLEQRAEQVRSGCERAWSGKVESLQKEMEDMKKTHEEQMHQLYAKVKVAVARKDSAIQALTREAAKYQEKIAVLEQKLQQQRKDFLKHK
ncbi:hypothetical protein JYU34_005647 [Plutella xylostella]|uniref:5-azacytidine-induced protein 1 n=1 Tax=Plutella xylostella TaxID=51655 RepID=A0ABQ7QTS0_PLUXY|nr:hypothetical protein JYU34_005647 [Plutella xylostella]